MKTFSCLFLVFGVGLGLAGEQVVHEVLQLADEEVMLVLPGSGAQPGYDVSIGRLETGEQEAGLMLWYQGHDAADACRVAIGQVTGSANLTLSAMSTCTLNVFRLTGSAALAGFPGNLTLSHYSAVWDKNRLCDTAAVLELDSTGLSGSVMLDVAGYCEPEGSYFISALGVSGSCSIGGLDAAEYISPAAYLYSGRLKEGTGALSHAAGFASYLEPEAHTLSIDTEGEHHFHGTVVGPLHLIKRGSGTQSFTGQLDAGCSFSVYAGELQVHPAGRAALSVAAVELHGGRLSCSGALETATLRMSGGELRVGGALKAADASFSGSSTLSATHIDGGSWTFQLEPGHAERPVLTLCGGVSGAPQSIRLEYDKSLMSRGWYQLVAHEGGSFQTSCLLDSGAAAHTETRNNTLLVYIADGELTAPRSGGALLRWQGAAGRWELGQGHASGQWQGPESNSNFLAGDSVVFSGAAEVELAGQLPAQQVSVNAAAGRVQFYGSGSISGTAALVKEGGSEWRIATANTCSGGTSIREGSIVTAHASALGSGEVQMSGGCLDMDGQALANDITVQGGAAVLKNAAAYTGTLRLQSAGLSLSGTSSLPHATLESSGSSRLSTDTPADAPFRLQQQIANTGHLELEGCYDITALAVHTAACLVDATGSINEQSGFVQDAGSRAQLTSGGGTLDAAGATILLHGQQVTPDESGSVSLPGALHPDTYTIAGEHRVSVSAIRRMAGEQLQRIRMSSGHLLVDSSTSCLQAGGGVVQVVNAHLGSGEHGGLEGSTRLEIHGDAVLHGRNTHSGGTHIISGSLRLTDAAALGNGPVLLGSGAAESGRGSMLRRSTSRPVLDLGNLPVKQHLQLQGQSELRGTSHFSGSITMHPGAEATLSPGSILQLGSGQVLTLSAGGNILHGQVELAGGTIVLSGGALTLHGVTTISRRTTIDLRQWQGLGAGTPFLQLDYPGSYNAEMLTLLLPEGTEGLRLHYDPQSGALQLRRGLAESTILAALPRNERRLYEYLMSQSAAAQGELQQLITTIRESEDLATLNHLLGQAGGLCYTSLLPGMQRHALAHAAELRRSAGSGQRLAPGSRTSVGLHVNHHRITQDDTAQGPGYESREWSARLQVEQHLTAHSSLGLALSSGSASITPGRGAGQGASHRDTRTRVDLYAWRQAGRHQFLLGAGLGMHEYELKRQRPGGGSSRVEGACGRSLTLSGAWECELAAQQLPGLRSHCSLSTVLVELDAIHERDGGSAAVQVKKASAHLTELSLGLSYGTRLQPELELQAEGAVLALAGDLAPALETSYAGAAGDYCRLSSARQRRYDYRAGLQLSYRLTPQSSLQTGISVQSTSQSTHLSLQLHF